MPIWMQTVIVIAAVAACASVIGYQLWLALRGKPSKIGSCCAKGCGAQEKNRDGPARVQFLPLESLERRRK
jgi:hypothetical protein